MNTVGGYVTDRACHASSATLASSGRAQRRRIWPGSCTHPQVACLGSPIERTSREMILLFLVLSLEPPRAVPSHARSPA